MRSHRYSPVVAGIVAAAAALLVLSSLASPPAHGAATSAPASPYTDREFALDKLAFEKEAWLDTYQKVGHHDPAWDADAVEFLSQYCRYRAYLTVWPPLVPPDVPTAEQVDRLGAALVAKKCDDLQVLGAYGLVQIALGRGQKGCDILRTPLRRMTPDKHPAANIAFIAHHLKLNEKFWQPWERAAVDQALERHCARMACNFPPARGQRYVRLLRLHDLLNHRPELEAAVVAALIKSPSADAWLQAVLTGERETHLAWGDRGAGTADTVPERGWRGFAEHLEKARERLTMAWTVDPSTPGAADSMITVAMGQAGQGGDDVRTWFDRALAAKADDTWALSGILWAYRPRWGGSHRKMFELGQEFAAGARFDTQIPWWLVVAVNEIARDRAGDAVDPANAAPDDEFYDALEPVFAGYARALPTPAARDWVASQHAAIAWRSGRLADVRRLLDSLGDRVVTAAFGPNPREAQLAISHAYAEADPTDTRARTATAELDAKQYDAAVEHFRALLASLRPKDKSRLYLQSQLARAEFSQQFAEDGWVDVMPKSVLYLWNPLHGRWALEPDGTLTGINEAGGLQLFFRQDLGERFEVVAKFFYDAPPNVPSACGLFLDHNGYTWRNSLLYSTKFKNLEWDVNGKRGSQPYAAPAPPAPTELHLRLWDGHMSATCNGAPVSIKDFDDAPRPLPSSARLMLGSGYQNPDATLHLTAVKVRKLSAKPESP